MRGDGDASGGKGRREYGSGTITKRTLKGGRVVHLAQFRHEGQRLGKTFDAEKEARRWLDRQRELAEQGALAIGGKLTLGALIVRWLELYGDRGAPKTGEVHRYLAKLAAPLAKRRATKLRPDEIEALLAELGERGLSPQTRGMLLSFLRAVYRDAQRWGLVAVNPAALARTPARDRKKPAYWTMEQLGAFLVGIRGHRYEHFYRLLCATALRQGELRGLCWNDIDERRGVIWIRDTLPAMRRHMTPSRKRQTKTRRERSIPLTGPMRAVIGELRAQRDPSRPFDLVFRDDRGQPLTSDQVRSCLERTCARLKLPRLTPHGLRHSAASAMLESGEHPRVVQEMLGHTTIQVTMNVYSHVGTDLLYQAAERLSARLEEAERKAAANEGPRPSPSDRRRSGSGDPPGSAHNPPHSSPPH